MNESTNADGHYKNMFFFQKIKKDKIINVNFEKKRIKEKNKDEKTEIKDKKKEIKSKKSKNQEKD